MRNKRFTLLNPTKLVQNNLTGLKVSAVFLLGLGLTSLQAQTMYVKGSNGTQTEYSLSSVQKMTFSLGNVTVHKTDNSAGVYALSALNYLSFEDLTITGIAQTEQQGASNMIAHPNPVTDVLNIDLTGLATGGTISILTLEGKVLQEQKADGANTVTLELSQLPQGIYLCLYVSKTEIKTVKIIKQ